MPYNNMLDVAPKTDYEVKYPEWGRLPADPYPQYMVVDPSYVSNAQPHQSLNGSLENYLGSLGVGYDVLPGEHTMIQLKHNIHFQSGSTQLSPSSVSWLANLGRYLSQHPDVQVVLDGHTDSTGNQTLNERLSEQRAKTVKTLLLNQQVSHRAIYTRGYGELMPECSNNSSSGKACNRRVELMLIAEN
ncbi:OmpA family protein [Vibrio sp. 10N.286.49.B3]|uniref:OmpA family protein n=1 Tax=Vibrio sp. 10N.286.49.B3 TaxID=1880855 RepID=UPI001F5389D3|nr:OmpA family protein [Vibrio sp. 10N.286.49.B3]